jgi:hypothetical protein
MAQTLSDATLVAMARTSRPYLLHQLRVERLASQHDRAAALALAWRNERDIRTLCAFRREMRAEVARTVGLSDDDRKAFSEALGFTREKTT